MLEHLQYPQENGRSRHNDLRSTGPDPNYFFSLCQSTGRKSAIQIPDIGHRSPQPIGLVALCPRNLVDSTNQSGGGGGRSYGPVEFFLSVLLLKGLKLFKDERVQPMEFIQAGRIAFQKNLVQPNRSEGLRYRIDKVAARLDNEFGASSTHIDN